MALQYYDYLFQGSGIGQLFYPSLSGSILLDIFTDLKNDIISSGKIPLAEPNPDPVELTDYALICYCAPFIKITSSLEGIPFYSAPEARYKFGTYTYTGGYEVNVDSEGNITSFPYDSDYKYIFYERQFLDRFNFNIVNSQTSPQDLAISDAALTDPPQAVQVILYAQSFASGASTSYANSIGVNLNPGVTADLVVYYGYGSNDISPSDPVDVIVFPW